MKKNVLLPLTLSALLACGGTSVFAADTTTETENNTAITEEAADATTEATPDAEEATTEDAAAGEAATEITPAEETATETTPAEEATTETAPTEETAATPLSISYTLDANAAEGDVHCIPLRATADALGLNVAWNAETRTATLSSETRTMDFAEGVDSYVSTSKIEGAVGMTAPVTYGVAPFINDEGIMYVPAASFGVLVGFDVVITDTDITITEQVVEAEDTTETAPAEETATEEATTEEATDAITDTTTEETTDDTTTTEETPAADATTDTTTEEAPASTSDAVTE